MSSSKGWRRFVIPWLNKKRHLDISDAPQTGQEIQSGLEPSVEKAGPTPSATPRPITDLGSNPFTSAPSPAPTNEVTPPEDGAK